VLRTLAYSDVFDFPLTVDEIHRYLVETAATLEQVDAAVATLAPARVRRIEGLVALAGREELAALRRGRELLAARLWPAARRQGLGLARLPFVRMVAVTGALAAGNPSADGDLDYFLVTAPRRLWLCRTAVIQRVRLARLRGHVLCPNYLVSEQALELEEPSLYAARELAQMQPLTGGDLYRRVRAANPWVARYLPNATGAPKAAGSCVEPRPGLARRAVESVLRSALGERLESWVSRRKIREIRGQARELAEVTLDRDRCKGHTSGHARRILRAYEERVRALGLDG
jgi:hypothetical protein